jgi:hypothetical protein
VTIKIDIEQAGTIAKNDRRLAGVRIPQAPKALMRCPGTGMHIPRQLPVQKFCDRQVLLHGVDSNLLVHKVPQFNLLIGMQ